MSCASETEVSCVVINVIVVRVLLFAHIWEAILSELFVSETPACAKTGSGSVPSALCSTSPAVPWLFTVLSLDHFNNSWGESYKHDMQDPAPANVVRGESKFLVK